MALFSTPAQRIAAEVYRISVQAHYAIFQGRRIFVARVDGAGGPTGSVPGVAEIIEAVEGLGWRLEQMSWAGSGTPAPPDGYLLFRLLHPPSPLPEPPVPPDAV